MYSWVVHFLSYFISISERDIGTERQEAGGVGKLKVFIYLFIKENIANKRNWCVKPVVSRSDGSNKEDDTCLIINVLYNDY